MIEADARAWIIERFGPVMAARLERFTDLVISENERQNLISPASVANIWSRHIVDSAQLLGLAPVGWETWIDIGTGGGFPGLVIALLAPERAMLLVEPRRKRADFLQRCCTELGLDHVDVCAAKIEAIAQRADIISARAVASPENLLRTARHCAKAHATWLLPRGRSGADDLACLSRLKQTMFHVEHSDTDPNSIIVILTGDGT